MTGRRLVPGNWQAPSLTVRHVAIVLLAACTSVLAASGQDTPPDSPWREWRTKRLPRIETPPDTSRIRVVQHRGGQARISGASGAAVDNRATMVRVVNLCTADEVIGPVHEDGSFDVRLYAPAGSSLQINTNMLSIEDIPPHFRHEIGWSGNAVVLNDLPPPLFEIVGGMMRGHTTSSSAVLLGVAEPPASPGRWPPVVKKAGPHLRYTVAGQLSSVAVDPGTVVELSLEIQVDFGRDVPPTRLFRKPPVSHPGFHRLFDAHGRQQPHVRLSASHLLTPTGLPIESHGEVVVEPRPDGIRVWHPGDSGLPVPWHWSDPGAWRVERERAYIEQRLRIEIPPHVPAGWYGVSVHVLGIGVEEYDAGEPAGSPKYVGMLRVGSPAPPRLSCLLLGSAGSDGSRGVIAQEDRPYYAINPRNVFMPPARIIPREDAFTGAPIVYPLDPYLPLLSRMGRPAPVVPASPIPFDFAASQLTVHVTSPSGKKTRLGPAPLVSGMNDLSVLRPDYVVRGRIVPPIPPTYGNPSLAEIYHLSGGGAFDHAFQEYGKHTVRLKGFIADLAGISYALQGTFDVHVARPLDMEVFPEPGTPLDPGVDIHPQVCVMPAFPAEVEMRWCHYPHSDKSRLIERTLKGRANRWGVYAPDETMRFDDPGEYVCDVTVSYVAKDGICWMAARRGASVVVTPDSKVIVHGERGNRSPTQRWRARWFVAGDNQFVAPPARRQDAWPEQPPPGHPPNAPWPPPPPPDEVRSVDLGHTCYPFESGDVAWLGPTIAFSLFPNITFEDPEGVISNLTERRWPGVRAGEGRAGLYPDQLRPEDRRAIGEMPYVCMTASGLPPTICPDDVDLWGYFYTTSWRPGLGVRSQVSEDMVPDGYWFFDDPYGHQFGNASHGDLAGDFKMNYGGGVFRDAATGLTNYGAYASMLTLIDGHDPLGARVMPPFDGLLPGSPACGPLLRTGGRDYDVFLTFGAIGPGTVMDQGECSRIAGVVWPPVSGYVAGEIISPSGHCTSYQTPVNSVGMFDHAGPVLNEAGMWRMTAQGVCNGPTSAGLIADLVPEADWPRGSGIGLRDAAFEVVVTPPAAPPIVFDVPYGARARPPRPLVLRGRLPASCDASLVHVCVRMPGQVIEQRTLSAQDRWFEYTYDPEKLHERFANIDTRIEVPAHGLELSPAWFDTVLFTFWAGQGEALRAGSVLLQGEDLYAQATTGRPLPTMPARFRNEKPRHTAEAAEPKRTRDKGSIHSSLLTMTPDGNVLYAAHRWSGEVVRLQLDPIRPVTTTRVGGEPRALALSPDGTRVYAALAGVAQVVALDANSLEELARFDIDGIPRAVLPSADGKSLFVADFHGDRILKLSAETGTVENESGFINRPACLAVANDDNCLYAVSSRTGEVVMLGTDCAILRRFEAPAQFNQCQTATLGPDGLLYAPQTRSDARGGGRMFDRSVFPVIAVADPQEGCVTMRYSPDLLVVPPHRPVEVAVDTETIYLASAGSDDVLAISIKNGFAKWHTPHAGLEPGGILLDAARERLYLLTITGQEIVTLDSETGDVLERTRFAHDPTPANIARGRYLFGTATDQRLTKDQWMSCA
ncbi:MAG: hypothetical protein ACYC6N_23265, partial [Pirellulaceae bacterium]